MFLRPPETQTTKAIFTCQRQCETRLGPGPAAMFASYSLMVDFNHYGTTAVVLAVVSGGNGLECNTAPLRE